MTYQTRKITVTLHKEGWAQLDDLLKNSNGPAMPDITEDRTINWLATTLLAASSDAWRRPGSWERQMLDMMGLAND